MKIHELAQKTGLTAPTIRFYEKEGLLDARHMRREANNYRFYYESAIEHLLMLKRIQAAGFTLAELRAVVQADEANELSHHKKLELLCQKMEEIDRKQVELRRIQTDLNQMYTRMMAARETKKRHG